MDPDQTALWMGGSFWNADEQLTCPECSCVMTAEEKRLSLWGMCSECENERLSDVVAG